MRRLARRALTEPLRPAQSIRGAITIRSSVSMSLQDPRGPQAGQSLSQFEGEPDEHDSGQSDERYRLTHSSQIGTVLRDMAWQKCLLNVRSRNGSEIVTSILHVDPATIPAPMREFIGTVYLDMVALLGRREGRRVGGPFGAADVGAVVHALRAGAVALHPHLAKRLRRARHLGVGDQDVLIGDALDLEAALGVPDRVEGHEVVAVATGEGHGVPAVLVRAGRAADGARERRDGDLRAFEWLVLGAGHAPADDVDGLRGCGNGRESDGEGGENERQYAMAHGWRRSA